MNKPLRASLAAVVGGLIALIFSGMVQAGVQATSVLDVTNFAVKNSAGSVMSAANFSTFQYTASSDEAAALGSTSTTRTSATPTSDLPVICVVGNIVGPPGPCPIGANVFPPMSGGPASNYATTDQLAAGVPIAGVAGAASTPARFANASYTGVASSTISGSSDSNNNVNANWIFQLPQNQTLTFEFNARAFLQVYVSNDEIFPGFATAAHNIVFSIVDLTSGATVWAFSPNGRLDSPFETADPFSLNNTVSLNAPLPSTIETIRDSGGTLFFSSTTPALQAGRLYQLSMRMLTNADVQRVDAAALGDRVWNDTNQNGQQDGAEAGVPGVTVQLFRYATACGSPSMLVGTTMTDANGIYHFTNLSPGNYFVRFVLPNGYVFSPKDAAAESFDSDPSPATGDTDCIPLAAGQTNNDIDAGIYMPVAVTAALGDFVWHDLNANGVQDAGEPGIPGVTVNLYSSCTTPTLVATDITDADGLYQFTNLAAGQYFIEVVRPAGYFFSSANQGADDARDSDVNPNTNTSHCVTLAAGEVNNTIDAGLYQAAAIGDFVWSDLNQNGIQDGGETGIPGVTVELFDCNDVSLGVTDVTDANGIYGFVNLKPGGYKVKFTLPSGFVFSPQDQGASDAVDSDATGSGLTACVTLQSNQTNTTVDAGMYRPSTAELGDFVWEDLDADGIQDANETGIPGVTVRLLNCSGNVIASTITNASGFYLFTGLAAGGYMVEFVKPDTYFFSPQNQGGDDEVDSDADVTTGRSICVTLAQGESNRTVDAGMYRLAAIGDRVWNDVNENGIQDVGEEGVAGVNVQLRLCADNTLVSSTATGAGGIYGFANLMPRDYYVVFGLPDGYSFTTANAPGSTEANDSDAIATGATSCVTLVSGQTNNDVDAGIFVLQPSVSIVKSTNGEDANVPTGPFIQTGATVTWTYVVTNTGPVDLVNLVVTDDRGVAVSCPKNTLLPGESMTCSATGIAVEGQYANVGTVFGESPARIDVTASDPSHYFGARPQIDIQKTPDNQTVVSGSTVTFSILVTNTGNVTLTNVTVTDAMAPGCNASLGTLAPGASTSYLCDLANVTADFENVADVTGTPPVGSNVTDSDNAFVEVIRPAIQIIKSPDTQTIVSGTTADFSIDVINTGNVVLINVTVTDALAPGCNASLGTLNPGQSTSYLCSLANVTMDFTNVAVVTGTPPVGPNVSDDDDARVDVITPAIQVVKTPDLQVVPVGSTVTFNIRVTNTGDTVLNNVSLSDPLAPLCANPNLGTLNPGQFVDVTCSVANVTAGFTNVATATGQPPAGPPVSDDDDAVVQVQNAGIKVTKYVSIDGGKTWEDANTAPGPKLVIPTSCGKDSSGYDKSYGGGSYSGWSKDGGSYSSGSYDSTDGGSYSGWSKDGGSYSSGSYGSTDGDSYSGWSKDGSWSGDGSNDGSSYGGGDSTTCPNVQFKFVIANTGGAPLSSLTLDDDTYSVSSCPALPASLAPGATFTCVITVKAEAGQHTNVATATGQSGGTTYTDSDPANYKGATGKHGCTPGYWDHDGKDGTFWGKTKHHPSKKFSDVFKDAFPGKTLHEVSRLKGGGLNALGRHAVAALWNAGADGIDYGMSEDDVIKHFNDAYPGNEWDYEKKKNLYAGFNERGCPDDDGSKPSVSITKFVNGSDANSKSTAPTIRSGSAVSFTYKVVNTGNTSLVNVTVSDSKGLPVSCPADTLEPGASMTCSASSTAKAICGAYTNWGKVVADTPKGVTVTDRDIAYYIGSTGSNGIDLEKFTNGMSVSEQPGPYLAVGSTVTWTYVITNKGSNTLRDIRLTDDQQGTISCPASSLSGGSKMTCRATGTAVKGQYTNIATVTASDFSGNGYSDHDVSFYFGKDSGGVAKGCRSDYWKPSKQHVHWSKYSPNDKFSDAFGVDAFPGKSLLQVLQSTGGGKDAMGREAVAALLNAASCKAGGVKYAKCDPALVVSDFKTLHASGDFDAGAQKLGADNDAAIPLDTTSELGYSLISHSPSSSGWWNNSSGIKGSFGYSRKYEQDAN